MWVSSACFVSSFSCGGYVAAMQAPWPGQPAAGGQREATMRDLSDRLACTGQGVCPGSANGDLEVTIATCPRSRRPATRDYSHLLKGQWDRAPGAPESTEVVLLRMASHPRRRSRPCASVEGTAGLRGAGCGCWVGVLGPLAWPEPVWRPTSGGSQPPEGPEGRQVSAEVDFAPERPLPRARVPWEPPEVMLGRPGGMLSLTTSQPRSPRSHSAPGPALGPASELPPSPHFSCPPLQTLPLHPHSTAGSVPSESPAGPNCPFPLLSVFLPPSPSRPHPPSLFL